MNTNNKVTLHIDNHHTCIRMIISIDMAVHELFTIINTIYQISTKIFSVHEDTCHVRHCAIVRHCGGMWKSTIGSKLTNFVPTRFSLRRLMERIFPRTEDLDMFCMDHYYSSVYRKFSSGMDRVSRMNILLDQVDAESLLGCIQEFYPQELADCHYAL